MQYFQKKRQKFCFYKYKKNTKMEVKFIEAQFAHKQNNFDVILCFVVKSTELHGFARH